jgi:hypothetical protein
VTFAERSKRIEDLLNSPEGRRRLAAAMARPIRPPPCCPRCGMPEAQFTDGHPWEECTVWRVMES